MKVPISTTFKPRNRCIIFFLTKDGHEEAGRLEQSSRKRRWGQVQNIRQLGRAWNIMAIQFTISVLFKAFLAQSKENANLNQYVSLKKKQRIQHNQIYTSNRTWKYNTIRSSQIFSPQLFAVHFPGRLCNRPVNVVCARASASISCHINTIIYNIVC